jgi:flavodoxin
MVKKCLVTYSSLTDNTEKVALKFKETFEKKGWQCDIFKVRKNAEDILRPTFDIRSYDFVCAGSGLRVHLPYNEILNMLRGFRTGMDPRIVLRFRDETIPYIAEPVPEIPPHRKDLGAFHHKIALTPDSPKAVVFITYSGSEFGPKEAEPAVQLLALELEHIGFQFIGQFCCPGKSADGPTPMTFHGDIRDRPNEKDLLKAEMFIEEKLEEIADRTK